MLSKALRLFNTIKFLKMKQINYRLYYFARAKFRKVMSFKPTLNRESKSVHLQLQKSICITNCYLGDGEFEFLNLSAKFNNDIDWNYSKYGKLWTYNLTYFDFLSQDDNKKHRLELIESFIDNIESVKDGLEPFPISLRGINWIKFLSYNSIKDKKIDNSLYAQYYILLDNLEYHLLGNHLLENGFSLLFGAYYFEDNKIYKKAKELLEEQLEEQILEDGGHFELSPMYHQIMLFRLLDCINLVKNNCWKNKELLEFLTTKAELMLGWLEHISYSDGTIPLFNDSAEGIAPTTNQLKDYAKRVNIRTKRVELYSSGYRKISNKSYECIVDVGNIGAEYIAGHVHSDTLSFELRVNGKPFIVDCGLSTYETCQRRDIERSTASHNTVEINGKNQSEVWGGFRVANRAYIVELNEDKNFIEATHNGYSPTLHTRRFSFEENTIMIEDRLTKDSLAVSRLHFHPTISKEYILEHIKIDRDNFELSTYQYSPKFNTQIDSIVMSIKFIGSLKIEIN